MGEIGNEKDVVIHRIALQLNAVPALPRRVQNGSVINAHIDLIVNDLVQALTLRVG